MSYHYLKYKKSEELTGRHNWIMYWQLLDCIHAIEQLGFTDEDSIKAILNHLDIISYGSQGTRKKPIFSQYHRFPGNATYVCIFAPASVDAITQMRSCIQQLLVIHACKGYDVSTLPYIEKFHDNLAALKRLVSMREVLFDRERFEREFDVPWSSTLR